MSFELDIHRINSASTLEEIQAIVRKHSVAATKEGGILYSGPVGQKNSHVIAVELAEKTRLPIIDNTPRAKFLSNGEVDVAIRDSAQRIFRAQGLGMEAAKNAAGDFRYGNAKAPANSPTNINNCLWCEASREFAGSLKGDIKVIATAAKPERVFGQVEVPAALRNPNVNSLAGLPIEQGTSKNP